MFHHHIEYKDHYHVDYQEQDQEISYIRIILILIHIQIWILYQIQIWILSTNRQINRWQEVDFNITDKNQQNL